MWLIDSFYYYFPVDALIKISSTEGYDALWCSMIPSLLLVSNPSIQFTVYEALKTEVQKLIGKSVSSMFFTKSLALQAV